MTEILLTGTVKQACAEIMSCRIGVKMVGNYWVAIAPENIMKDTYEY